MQASAMFGIFIEKLLQLIDFIWNIGDKVFPL